MKQLLIYITQAVCLSVTSDKQTISIDDPSVIIVYTYVRMYFSWETEIIRILNPLILELFVHKIFVNCNIFLYMEGIMLFTTNFPYKY